MCESSSEGTIRARPSEYFSRGGFGLGTGSEIGGPGRDRARDLAVKAHLIRESTFLALAPVRRASRSPDLPNEKLVLDRFFLPASRANVESEGASAKWGVRA